MHKLDIGLTNNLVNIKDKESNLGCEIPYLHFYLRNFVLHVLISECSTADFFFQDFHNIRN